MDSRPSRLVDRTQRAPAGCPGGLPRSGNYLARVRVATMGWCANGHCRHRRGNPGPGRASFVVSANHAMKEHPMLPRRLTALVFAAAGLALVGGCTTDGASRDQAGPAPTTTVAVPPATTEPGELAPANGVATTPPAQSSSTPTAGPGAAGPDLRAVRDCPGCSVRQVRREARPGISVALIVGENGQSERGMLVSFRSRSGEVLDQVAALGDYWEPVDGRPNRLVCDISVHCLLPAGIGAHSMIMTAVSVGRAGELTSVAKGLVVNHPQLAAQDLERDGVQEIVGVLNDCRPACAGGRGFWVAYKLAGPGYLKMGCARYDGKARPPATLDPAACPT